MVSPMASEPDTAKSADAKRKADRGLRPALRRQINGNEGAEAGLDVGDEEIDQPLLASPAASVAAREGRRRARDGLTGGVAGQDALAEDVDGHAAHVRCDPDGNLDGVVDHRDVDQTALVLRRRGAGRNECEKCGCQRSQGDAHLHSDPSFGWIQPC